MANFKLYFNNDDIRRIRLDAPTWDTFRNKLQQLYPEYAQDLAVRYKDEEGDLITITTGREWETMLESSNGISPIKLFISEPGVQPKVQVSVIEQVEEKEKEEEKAPVEEQQPADDEQIVELAEGEKEEFELVQPTGETSAPTPESSLGVAEMDIHVFFERLQQQACSFLNPGENEALKKAKEFFEGLVPDSDSPFIQDLAGAVQSVKRAVSDGYTNFKELPEFKELMELISGKEEEADPKRWVHELEQLESMGFVDAEANQALLIKYKGNMQRVINALLAA